MALPPDTDSENFLIEVGPVRETELEILPDPIPPGPLESPSPSAHSFHSSLLDDFQLDLELECEEDNFMAIDSNPHHSWNSDATPVHLFGPLLNAQSQSQTHCSGDNQSLRNPTIAELIRSEYVDHKEKGGEIVAVKKSISVKRASDEFCATSIQANHLKSYPPLDSSNKIDDISQNCVICPACKILFSSLKALQSHFSDQHNKVKSEPEDYECSSCCSTQSRWHCPKKDLTKQRKNLTIAKNQKLNESLGPFYCTMCSYAGKKKGLLQQHMKSLHNPKRETFACKLCPFSCVQERSFKVHKLTHEGMEGKFACDQCGKLFFTMSILKRHARTHNVARPYVCDFYSCKQAFTIKSRLTDHIRTVHKKDFTQDRTESENSEESDCQQNQAITQVKKLNRPTLAVDLISKNEEFPVLSQSGNAEPRVTSQCQSDNQQNSNTDFTVVYDIILPVTESSSFNDKAQLDMFSQSVDLLQSDINKRLPSSSKSLLQPTTTTINIIQNSEEKFSYQDKKFQCSWAGCGKRFRDSFNLRKHMCTHTGEMENACPFCRYRCIQKSALDKHMETHRKL